MELSNVAEIPTKYGSFNSYAVNDGKGVDHYVIYKEPVRNLSEVPVRIHSECLTGDVFSSLKCDCGEQLDFAMSYIDNVGKGIIIYLRQEGRGIGLFNKINAYNLQDNGLDTIDSNLELGLEVDSRDFNIAADILKNLGVTSIELLTNNPDKVSSLERNGIKISKTIPILITPNSFNKAYLNTKKEFFKHTL